MSASSLARFTAQAARARAALWPAQVLCADSRSRAVAKSASKTKRSPQEHGAGWVLATEATLNFLPAPASGYRPAIGETLTLQTCASEPTEEGTQWRVVELIAGGSSGEPSARCIRLDD